MYLTVKINTTEHQVPARGLKIDIPHGTPNTPEALNQVVLNYIKAAKIDYHWYDIESIPDHPIQRKPKKKLHEDRKHSHYWIEDNNLFESYRTLRGLRYRQLLEVKGMPDIDKCTEKDIIYIEKTYLN